MVVSSDLYSHIIEIQIETNEGRPRRKVLSASLSHSPVTVYWGEWHLRSLWTLTVHLYVIWASTGESYIFDGGPLRIVIGRVMGYWANPDLRCNE